MRPRHTLFDSYEDVSGRGGRAFGKAYLADGSGFWRLQFVLHFHCFDDDSAVTFFDRVADADKHANDLSGHCGPDLGNAVEITGGGRTPAKPFRIGDTDVEIMFADTRAERSVFDFSDGGFVNFRPVLY